MASATQHPQILDLDELFALVRLAEDRVRLSLAATPPTDLNAAAKAIDILGRAASVRKTLAQIHVTLAGNSLPLGGAIDLNDPKIAAYCSPAGTRDALGSLFHVIASQIHDLAADPPSPPQSAPAKALSTPESSKAESPGAAPAISPDRFDQFNRLDELSRLHVEATKLYLAEAAFPHGPTPFGPIKPISPRNAADAAGHPPSGPLPGFGSLSLPSLSLPSDNSLAGGLAISACPAIPWQRLNQFAQITSEKSGKLIVHPTDHLPDDPAPSPTPPTPLSPTTPSSPPHSTQTSRPSHPSKPPDTS